MVRPPNLASINVPVLPVQNGSLSRCVIREEVLTPPSSPLLPRRTERKRKNKAQPTRLKKRDESRGRHKKQTKKKQTDKDANSQTASETAVEADFTNTTDQNNELERHEIICRGMLKAYFPCVIDHQSYIDDELFSHVDYDPYYEQSKHLVLNNSYKSAQKEAETPIGDDIRAKNIIKRGSRVYACPYCWHTFPPGQKNSVKRHINQRTENGKTYDPACAARRSEEPKVKGRWQEAKIPPELIFPHTI